MNEYIHPEKNQKGKVTRITGVVTDITRLKKLESQLLQSLKETDLIINSVQDIIYVIDLKGRLIGWNKRLEEWSGYDKKDLRKKTIFRFFVKQDRQEIEKAFQQVLHHGKVQVEGRIVNQKGEQRLFDWSGVLLKDEEGRSIGITGVGKDISHQEEVRRHLYLAGKVQYGMLPPEINNSDVEIKTFYSPKSVVSGDFFNYEWNKERNRLTGYMIDVMGHGLEASLHTSALHVLFNQLNDEDIPLHEKLHWINRESKHYFHEEYFATAFCFEFDMTKRILHYVSGGINHFLRRTDEGWQEIKVPGSFIGVFEDATFENHRLSFAGGDSFLFFSDGLKPYLNDINNDKTRSFHDTMQLIERLPNSSDQEDDISVIGIRFK